MRSIRYNAKSFMGTMMICMTSKPCLIIVEQSHTKVVVEKITLLCAQKND